jgi:DNA-binding response OmpR family regulator
VRRILVVDDRLEVCELIRTHLTECGYAVDQATDGAEARRLLASACYDGALLDVRMPGEGGLVLAALAQRAGARVLLMSGHPSPPASAPPFALLLKPFRLAELEAAVAALVGPPGRAD